MLLGLLAFCTFHGITEGSIHRGCDSTNSIPRGQGDWCKVPLSIKHADLIRAIRVLKVKLPFAVHFNHGRGHQDDHVHYDALPHLAQLNVQMDREAKNYLLQLAAQAATSQPSAVAYEGWQCEHNPNPVHFIINSKH